MTSFALINFFRPYNVSLRCKSKTRAKALKSHFQRDVSLRFDGRVPRKTCNIALQDPISQFLWLCKALKKKPWSHIKILCIRGKPRTFKPILFIPPVIKHLKLNPLVPCLLISYLFFLRGKTNITGSTKACLIYTHFYIFTDYALPLLYCRRHSPAVFKNGENIALFPLCLDYRTKLYQIVIIFVFFVHFDILYKSYES